MSVHNRRINRLNLINSNPSTDWNKTMNDSYSAEKRSMTNSTPDSSSGVVSDDHCHTIFSDYTDTFSTTTTTHHKHVTPPPTITSGGRGLKKSDVPGDSDLDVVDNTGVVKHKVQVHRHSGYNGTSVKHKEAREISIIEADIPLNKPNTNIYANETDYRNFYNKSNSRHNRLSMTPSPSPCPTFVTSPDNTDDNQNCNNNNNIGNKLPGFGPIPEKPITNLSSNEEKVILKSISSIAQKPPTPKRHHHKYFTETTQTTSRKTDCTYQNISDFHQNFCKFGDLSMHVHNQSNVVIKNEGRLKKQIKSIFHPTSKTNTSHNDSSQSQSTPSPLPRESRSRDQIQSFPQHKSQRKISFSPETINYSREDKSPTKIYDSVKHEPKKLQFNETHEGVLFVNDLEDHLITHIFKYLHSNELCKCAMVCKRWYQLVWSPILWSHICVQNPKLNMDKALKCMTTALSCDTLKVCLIVESIDLSGSRKLSDKGLYIVANRCPELKKLILDGCIEVTNIAIFEIVSKCINLELLSLSGCQYVTSISLTPEANLQATVNNKQIYLNHLDMTDCINVDDSSLQMVVTYCSRLSYLYLRRCIKISDLGVQYAASYCNKLKELSISDCPNVSDLGMRDVSRLESNLRYLSVAKCRRITDTGLKCVTKKCLKIRYLNLRGCDRITEDGITFLAAYSSKLRSLDLGNCSAAMTDRSIVMLADGCQQLKRLSLKGCTRLTDEGLTQFAQKCPQLQQINLIDCKVTYLTFNALHKYCDDCIIEHNNPGVAFNYL